MGDKSRDGGAIKHRCDNCVQRACVCRWPGPRGAGGKRSLKVRGREGGRREVGR